MDTLAGYQVKQRLAISDVACEISQKNSEETNGPRRGRRAYLLRSETLLLSLDWLKAREEDLQKRRLRVDSQEGCEGRTLGK